jgi:proline dehydrogenase
VVSALGKATLAITERGPVRKLFTGTRPGRAVSTRFVAGETLDDATAVARGLNAAGATVSMDHLGENVADRGAAEGAAADYIAVLDRIGADGIEGNISVKLTQLGLGTDDDLAAESLTALSARAAQLGTTVTIDMEESRHTAATISLFERAQSEYGNLGVALQSYLRRSPMDLERVIAAHGHVRICKGAYAEPPEIAFQEKGDVDDAFDRLTTAAFESPNVIPAIATHDEARISHAVEQAERREGPWEFQMLYGVRVPLQRELLAAGHSVRIYIPYGVAWYPYLTRRLAERPANMTFFLRALFGRS